MEFDGWSSFSIEIAILGVYQLYQYTPFSDKPAYQFSVDVHRPMLDPITSRWTTKNMCLLQLHRLSTEIYIDICT